MSKILVAWYCPCWGVQDRYRPAARRSLPRIVDGSHEAHPSIVLALCGGHGSHRLLPGPLESTQQLGEFADIHWWHREAVLVLRHPFDYVTGHRFQIH